MVLIIDNHNHLLRVNYIYYRTVYLLKFSSIISFRFVYVQCYVCAEKPEVNVMLNLETTTVKTLEERILKVGLLKGGFLKFSLPLFRGMDNLRARKASLFTFLGLYYYLETTTVKTLEERILKVSLKGKFPEISRTCF
jgi:hypothetical protein